MIEQVLALAQQSSSGGGGGFFPIIMLAMIVCIIASLWKVFVKAGQPGWAAIVPIYNIAVLCKVAGRPAWWVLLMFIPIVNLLVMALISIDVAKAFGKGAGFGVGLWLLGFIFYPMLGFGGAQYVGREPALA